jgi:hypothetical protein
MPRKNNFQYAQLPVFKYQTFDRESLTFTNHPIIPPERIVFSDRHADDLKGDEPAEPEVIELDSPTKDIEVLDGMFSYPKA